MRCYVLMGVSGCGKTSVGEALADRCGVTFIDGDDLHPPANIAKMSAGLPLEDSDRAPWLADVGRALAATEGMVVIGCSALKRVYRNWIRERAGEPVFFLHLAAPKPVLVARVSDRPGHFMPASLLDSQFAALEPLQEDESGAVIDISKSVENVIVQTQKHIEGKVT